MRRQENKNPFKVKEVKHDFFSDFSHIVYYDSIRPGRNTGDPQVHDLCALMYKPDGTIMYKVEWGDEWLILPQRKRHSAAIPKKLHDSAPKIKGTKYTHLQELKVVIPQMYHEFYDNLLH